MNCGMVTMTLSFTELQRRWATLALGWVTASVESLMALQLTLVDQNSHRPCNSQEVELDDFCHS